MEISKQTAKELMNAFASIYMDTHYTTGDFEVDKENIENSARSDFIEYCEKKGISFVADD